MAGIDSFGSAIEYRLKPRDVHVKEENPGSEGRAHTQLLGGWRRSVILIFTLTGFARFFHLGRNGLWT